MQRGELVIGRRDERHESFLDERLPIRVQQRFLDAGVDDAHTGRGVLHVVVDQFGIVLRSHAGKVLALRFGYSQSVERVFDVVGKAVPVALHFRAGLYVRGDVVHVEPAQSGAPVRAFHTMIRIEGSQAKVQHPAGLVLAFGDLAHDGRRKARVKALDAGFVVREIVEAAIDVVDVRSLLRHGFLPTRLRCSHAAHRNRCSPHWRTRRLPGP